MTTTFHQIVVGNTELGVEVKFKHLEYPVYINPSQVRQNSIILRINSSKI